MYGKNCIPKAPIFFCCVLCSLLIISLLSCVKKETLTVKVMSYNTHHSLGMDDSLNIERIAQIIKKENPDLCAIQEIDNFCERSGVVNQTEYFAKQTNLQPFFVDFMSYQGGLYGLASLTKQPPLSNKSLVLPHGKFEARKASVQEVAISPSCTVAFATVHLDWVDDSIGTLNRLDQAKSLVVYLNMLGRPTIVTGDFNCTPSSPTMKYFEEQGFVFVGKGADSLSFQVGEQKEIDHVIFRNTKEVQFKAKSSQLLHEPVASDHRPLVVELEITVESKS